MRREVRLVKDAMEVAALCAGRSTSVTAGAVIQFVGVVRGTEGDSAIEALEYEAFEAMALHQFGKLLDALEVRWAAVESVTVVHRLGRVAAGEPSLWVEVTAPHRGEAFASCQWLIDEMKKVVPIWKRPIRGGSGGLGGLGS